MLCCQQAGSTATTWVKGAAVVKTGTIQKMRKAQKLGARVLWMRRALLGRTALSR
jgi:hypothetical protein